MRINENDWENMFPGEVVQIGTTTIDVRPLTIEQLAKVIRRIGAIRKPDVTEDELIDLFIAQSPEIIEICTGLHKDDVSRLPAAESLKLVQAIIKINQASQDGLLKNFQAMAGVISLAKKQGLET